MSVKVKVNSIFFFWAVAASESRFQEAAAQDEICELRADVVQTTTRLIPWRYAGKCPSIITRHRNHRHAWHRQDYTRTAPHRALTRPVTAHQY